MRLAASVNPIKTWKNAHVEIWRNAGTANDQKFVILDWLIHRQIVTRTVLGLSVMITLATFANILLEITMCVGFVRQNYETLVKSYDEKTNRKMRFLYTCDSHAKFRFLSPFSTQSLYAAPILPIFSSRRRGPDCANHFWPFRWKHDFEKNWSAKTS